MLVYSGTNVYLPILLKFKFYSQLLIFLPIDENLIGHRSCIDNLPARLITVNTHELR